MLILPTQYLPSIYWMTLYLNSEVAIDVHEHYQKMSLRNRCEIATPNGKLKLSVPLRHGRNQRRPVKDVEINNDEKWEVLHSKSLSAAYRKSPYFELLENELSDFFSKKYNHLIDANSNALNMIEVMLGITARNLQYTEDYQEKSHGLDNILKKTSALGLPPLIFPPYQQVFLDRHPFIPNLSVLDLIFCVGPQEALLYMKNLFSEFQNMLIFD